MEGLFDMTIDVDNGQLGAEGSAAYAGGTYTVEGSGADVWNNTGSNFRFVFTELSGDFELTADVAVEGGLETQDWIKSMLYAAESLDGWGNYITTRVRRDGQYSTQWRTGGEASDGSTASALRVSGLNPARQRLTRSGDTFTTSYLDADGNWQVLDTNEAVLQDPLFVGLGVCSHDLGELAVGTFSNIELTQGGGGMGIFENAVTLDAAEYDHVAVPGSVSESDGVYTLMGNGRDIWDNGDEAFFIYNELAGSNSIQAKVKWIDAKGTNAGGNDWAKIGVMIREKGDVPESKHYWIELRCGAGDPALGDQTDAQWRPVEGQASSNTQIYLEDGTTNVASADGVWYRVSRNASADLMTSEYSMDGINWNFAHSMTMEMADVAAYGIIITSHTGDDQLVTAEASDVKITQAHPTSSASNWELFK
jgi:regulation of enolase protein 1 (concanavalin A-like superfamily)